MGKEKSSGDALKVEALKDMAQQIRSFIELSLHGEDDGWEKWLHSFAKEANVKCWEKKDCSKKACPAYQNVRVRCWLAAGTMCGGEVQGEFAVKYNNCAKCDVYQEEVYTDPVSEIYEHLVALIHSIKSTHDKLKTMAIKDPLTGVFNRYFFNEMILKELEKAKRYGENLSVIMLDIDNFKHINDYYGHLHGDAILKECAKILAAAVRKYDIVCRFGGDEFIIVVPQKDSIIGNALMRRIEGYISKRNKDYSNGGCKLSVSMGCAEWSEGKDIIKVISEADQAMFDAKRNKKSLRAVRGRTGPLAG